MTANGSKHESHPLAGPVQPEKPLVSVVMPTYNHEQFVLRAVDSVFSQTLRQVEVIVVNDGSKDGTEKLLSPLADAGKIRFFSQANQGQSRARNRGISEAHGKYIAFLDDDDLWPTDKLEWQTRYLEENANVGIIGGILQVIDEKGNPGELGRFTPSISFQTLFCENPFLSPGQTLIRTSLLRELGGMNAAIWGADDWDLWFRAAQRSSIVMENRLSLFYRVHSGNSSRHTARLLRGCCHTIRSHLGSLPAAPQRDLKRTAFRVIFDGLGIPLVSTARQQLLKGNPLACFRSLGGLSPLGSSLLFDPKLPAGILNEFFLAPIRRRLKPVSNPRNGRDAAGHFAK